MESLIPENSNNKSITHQVKKHRRYRPQWEDYKEHKDWLQASPSSLHKAICKVCNKEIMAELSGIKRHACGARHLAEMARSKALSSLNASDVDECSESMETCTSENKIYKGLRKRTTSCGRNRLQRYRPEWEEFKEHKGWLRPCPSDVYRAMCIVCNAKIIAEISTVRRHAKGAKHLANVKSKHLVAHCGSVASDCSKVEEVTDDTEKYSEDICFDGQDELLLEIKPLLPDETQSRVSKVCWTGASLTFLIEQFKSNPEHWDLRWFDVMESHKENFLDETAKLLMAKYPLLGDLTPGIVKEKFRKLRLSYERERLKVFKSGKASTWMWYEPMSFLENVSGLNVSVANLESPVIHRDMLNCDRTSVKVTDKENLESKNLSSPLEPSVPENLPSLNNFSASSSAQRILPENTVINSEKKVYDITALAIEHLQKNLEQEKDFAYGIGLAVESHLRTLSVEGRVKMAAKIMALLRTNKSIS